MLRITILVGWAIAVIWIYLGNLVNFHQNRIWGKQLIPVACSSTRYKEKDAASFVKNDNGSKSFASDQQFDFTTPDQQVPVLYPEQLSTLFIPSVIPVLQQRMRALSLRGPPTA